MSNQNRLISGPLFEFDSGGVIYRLHRDTNVLEAFDPVTDMWVATDTVVAPSGSNYYIFDSLGLVYRIHLATAVAEVYDPVGQTWTETTDIGGGGTDYEYQYNEANTRWERLLPAGDSSQYWYLATNGIWTELSTLPGPSISPGDGTLKTYDPDPGSGSFSGSMTVDNITTSFNTGYAGYRVNEPHVQNWLHSGWPQRITKENGDVIYFEDTSSTVRIVDDPDLGFVSTGVFENIITGLGYSNNSKSFYKYLGSDKHLLITSQGANNTVRSAVVDLNAIVPGGYIAVNHFVSPIDFGERGQYFLDVGNSKVLYVAPGASPARGLHTVFFDYSADPVVISGTPQKRTGSGALDGWINSMYNPAVFTMFPTGAGPIYTDYVAIISTGTFGGASGQYHGMELSISEATDTVTWTAIENPASPTTPLSFGYGGGFGVYQISDDKYFTLSHNSTQVTAKIISRASGLLSSNLIKTHTTSRTTMLGTTFFGTTVLDNAEELLFFDNTFVYKIVMKETDTDYNWYPVITHGQSISTPTDGYQQPLPNFNYIDSDQSTPFIYSNDFTVQIGL